MTQLEKYRENLAAKMTAIWTWVREIVLFVITPSNRITWRDAWNQLLLRLCVIKSRITVDSKEKKRLLDWVATKIRKGKPPTDFNESWKNGIALCALVEGIVRGSCPRYDLLNPEHANSNLKLALHLIEKNVRIKPGLTVEDFGHYDAVTERKLVCLVSQLKLASAKLHLKSAVQQPVINLNPVTTIGAKGECIAKGMGLMLAVKGRKARFHIYLKSSTIMNIVVEIRGPENTICSERITNRSPRRRSALKLEENQECRKIHLEYNIQPGKITVSYTPLVIGSHRLSIIWQGQHIIGSPYKISVDDAARTVAAEPKEIKRLIVPLKRADSLEEYSKKENSRCRKLNTISFGDVRKLGNVTRKRILRYYLVVDGKEVVIENNDLETLAKAVINLRAKHKSGNSDIDLPEQSNNSNIPLDHDKSSGNNLAHSDSQKETIVSSNLHVGIMLETERILESSNHKSACNSGESVISTIHILDEISTYNMLGENNENLQQSDQYVTPSGQNNLCHLSTNLHSKENKALLPNLQIPLSSNNVENNSSSLCDTPKRALHNTREMSSDNSCDFFQQCNVPANEISMVKKCEHNKNNCAESFHLKSSDSAMPTTRSSSTSDIQIRGSTEMLVDNAFESGMGETCHVKVAVADHCYHAMSDNQPLNNTRIQNLDVLNQNIVKRHNSKEEPKRISGDLESCNDNLFLQSSQTMCLSDNNSQQNSQDETTIQGMAGKTNKEKICSENFDQICFPKNIIPKSHLTAYDNDAVEYSSEEKSSAEYNFKHYQESKTILKQFNNGIDAEFSGQEIVFRNDQKNDSIEEKLEGSKAEEKEATRENYTQRLQSDVTINLSDEEITLSGISNKEKISSDHEIKSKNEEEISPMEGQGNNIEEIVHRTHHGNKVRNFTDDSFNGIKQPTNEDNDWIDHRRKGFLLGLIDKNFKIVESLDMEEYKSSKTCYHKFKDETVSEDATLMLHDSCTTMKLPDNAKSDISKKFGKFISSDSQGDSSATIDVTPINKSALSTDEPIKSSVDTLCTGKCNFERNPGNLNLFESEINMRTASNGALRYSQETNSIPEPAQYMMRFDEGDSSSAGSNFTNSHSEGSQNIVEPSDLLDTLNQNQTSANKTLEKVIHNIDIPMHNYEQCTLGTISPFQKQDNNSDNAKVQSEETLTTLQNSELLENIHSQHKTVNELKESSFKSVQKKLCCSPQKPQCMSDNSINSNFLELPPLVMQSLDSNTKQRSSEELENVIYFDDDEEDEFPFSAIVQAKKEYWEKKLEEKSPKQIQKACSGRKDCNNVDKLKSFWLHVAKDSKTSERTKVHTHRSISN